MKKYLFLLICMACLASEGAAFDPDQISIHGFISQGYLASDQYEYLLVNTQDGTFEFHEFGLNFSVRPTENLRVGLQLLSRDFGQLGNNDVTLDWGIGDYRYRNWLGIRVGKLKRPSGLYGESRDIDAARTSILLPTSLYSEMMRDLESATIGAGLYGILPGGLEYQMQYGKVDVSTETGLVKILDDARGVQTLNVEVTKNAPAFQLLWRTPLEGLRLSGTYSLGPEWKQQTTRGTSVYDTSTVVMSVEYTNDHITVAVEYKQGETKTTSEFYAGIVNYRFTDWFELGSYYAVGYRDKNDKDGRNFEQWGQPAALAWAKDLALSGRFDLDDNWILKLEGHWFNGLYGVTGDIGQESSEDWYFFAAKVTFSF